MSDSSSTQLSLGLNPAHRNQYLFSDHYLNTLLLQTPRWIESLPAAQTFQAWLRQRYEQEQNQLATYTEAQLEEHWFKPILTHLGHVFETQAGLPGLEKDIKRPDYVFFPDEATRKTAAKLQKTEDYATHALAIGEVKVWDRPLGKKLKDGGPSFEEQNPSWQISYYVQASGLNWGILSNGRLWRLVHRASAYRLSIYYEVDLIELLSRPTAEALRYFTLFFQPDAFRPDAQGRLFLDEALAASNAYARALEEDLRENVYRALENLMQGFLDLPGNKLGLEHLRVIYDNSLYLLYRLLFILYGESRGLLPLNHAPYHDHYSLHHLKEEIAALNPELAAKTTGYWGRLRDLFAIIDGGEADLNQSLGVPRYNGGLFSPKLHPFLEDKKVGDQALVAAIDLLSRRDGEFVDYRTLGVRQLGSIYEGLLEYQPRIAAEPMIAVREGKGERWLAVSEAGPNAKAIDQCDIGQVYLATDRGERKATGSYYTPEYIVQYIVDNTLGPLVAHARDAARQANQPALLADNLLNLKVLDPAMGSGHFLVEATEYLALALATDPYLPTANTAEEDVVYWKRRVVERCIYGVDKNRLSVELAKLSLWLATVAADQPLSFLDHHLKHGDSLIGARVADLGSAPTQSLSKKEQTKRAKEAKAEAYQYNLFEQRLSEKLPIMIKGIFDIVNKESNTYERVQAKEAADEAVRQLKAPFEAVANLWVSAYFGNAYPVADYDTALYSLSQPEVLSTLPAIQAARSVNEAHDFFHWELAFPEVFYDAHGQPLRSQAGFDAVIGNPPYISVINIPDDIRKFMLSKYATASGRFDVYIVFTEKSLDVTKYGGVLSFIMPIKWAVYANGRILRDILLDRVTLNYLVNVSQSQVFPDPTTYPCIPVITKASPPLDHHVTIFNPPSEMPEMISQGNSYMLQAGFGTNAPAEWFNQLPERIISPALNATTWEMHTKLHASSEQLGTIYGIEQCIRVGSENKRKKMITTNPPSQGRSRFHPVIDGEDIRRYTINWSSQFIDYRPEELYNPKTPEILHRSKILIKRIAERLTVAYDTGLGDDYFYPLNTVYALIETAAMPLSALYHVALLNSTLLDWIYKLVFAAIGIRGGYIEFREYLQYLPLRRIAFTTAAQPRAALHQDGLNLYAQYLKDQSPTALRTFVAQRLAAQPEQADVIHDLLADLAQSMIDLHQQQQHLTVKFWTDLEGVTDAATFKALREKGKQEAGLYQQAEACRPFVREDSHATRRLDESLAWSEDAFKGFVKAIISKVKNLSDLVGVHHRHHAAYTDAVTRLRLTDELIDQIVYPLYGLTDDEIKIVEGTT